MARSDMPNSDHWILHLDLMGALMVRVQLSLNTKKSVGLETRLTTGRWDGGVCLRVFCKLHSLHPRLLCF
jgi:hypothetical protein